MKIPSNRSLNFHNRYHCDPWCIHLLNKVKSKRQKRYHCDPWCISTKHDMKLKVEKVMPKTKNDNHKKRTQKREKRTRVNGKRS